MNPRVARFDEHQEEPIRKLLLLDNFAGWTAIARLGLRLVWAKYGAYADYVSVAHEQGKQKIG